MSKPRSRQSVHSPSAAARVRIWAVPSKVLTRSFQETPIRENALVSVRGRARFELSEPMSAMVSALAGRGSALSVPGE
ncbi:hypothetical protein ACFC08_07450 [Streptomyces sp. NPDC056112]|uniref:hypothetical protein n=1 Tax=Streptomyces sp. NPDC056112 TaxID=3345715 RepID=UPI0035E2EC76